MVKHANDLKLDAKKLQVCLGDERIDKAVQADITDAEAVGIGGTPTFVIGRTEGDSVQGERVVGAQPLAAFEGRIDALLGASR
jgi:predicted DsbA family dithiol-disulfide isomerase